MNSKTHSHTHCTQSALSAGHVVLHAPGHATAQKCHLPDRRLLSPSPQQPHTKSTWQWGLPEPVTLATSSKQNIQSQHHVCTVAIHSFLELYFICSLMDLPASVLHSITDTLSMNPFFFYVLSYLFSVLHYWIHGHTNLPWGSGL